MVINISSPNTPGLRKLQGRKQLKDLIKQVQAARDEMQWGEKGLPPLLVKIAPDLSKQDREDIAMVALSLCLDGLMLQYSIWSIQDGWKMIRDTCLRYRLHCKRTYLILI